jgi:cell division septum initiation protein DivIVA
VSILDQIAFDQIADERDNANQENKQLKERIKRLEEAGSEAICPIEYASRARIWTKAKEAKP